jgi:hypothetical protein
MGAMVIGCISFIVLLCTAAGWLWMTARQRTESDYWWGLMAGYAALYLYCVYSNPLHLTRLPFPVILLLILLTGYCAGALRLGRASPSILAGFFLAGLILGCGQS